MTENLTNSRNEVMSRMLEAARARGGNAVIGMRFDTSEMGDTWTEICAYGTAVVADPGRRGGPPDGDPARLRPTPAGGRAAVGPAARPPPAPTYQQPPAGYAVPDVTNSSRTGVTDARRAHLGEDRVMGIDEDFRIEKDSMGEVRVPAAAKWRAQTQRAVENFPISGQPIERELIAGLALIKGAGARVRAARGLLDQAKADAIAAAARRGRPRRLGRRVPDRRLPDRLGHLVEHERQRGAGQPRRRAARRVRPPE